MVTIFACIDLDSFTRRDMKKVIRTDHCVAVDETESAQHRVWQKWQFSVPQKYLWLIKDWFSPSTPVLKFAILA